MFLSCIVAVWLGAPCLISVRGGGSAKTFFGFFGSVFFAGVFFPELCQFLCVLLRLFETVLALRDGGSDCTCPSSMEGFRWCS